MKPSWDISILDLEGPWGWKRLKVSELKSLQQRLSSFSSMTWNEIDRIKSCNFMDSMAISKEAKERFRELGYEEWADNLYKLRLDGPTRIWGIRDQHVFKVLWWDPDHSVYPMNLADN